jgi:flagellar L-ring protein precursor FlgH
MSGKSRVAIVAVAATWCVGAGVTGAWAQTKPAVSPAKPTPAAAAVANQNTYEDMYRRYLEAAKSTPAPTGAWMTDLMMDVRARHVNDLVTIRVVESLAAAGSADANVTKNGKVDIVFPSPISKPLSKIAPSEVDTKFAGAGGTTRTSTMTAVITARVTDVLPNGDLVVEGVRQIEVNADRQVVVLTGVVRQADLGLDNTASSASIGQLRIQCIGQGLVKDNMTPGWLIRALNKVF